MTSGFFSESCQLRPELQRMTLDLGFFIHSIPHAETWNSHLHQEDGKYVISD